MPINPIQSVFSQQTFSALPGQLAEAFGPCVISNKIGRGLIKAGHMAFKVPTFGGAGTSMVDPGTAYQNPTGGSAAAATAILATGGASSLSVQNLGASAFNGTVGSGLIQPARQITFTFNNNANWDATNITLTGYNQNGALVSETIAVPDSGNATVTSTNSYSQVTGVSIPAQSGTGGTFTMGIAALGTTLTLTDCFGIVVRQPLKTSVNSGALYGYPGQTVGTVYAEYVDGDLVPCLTTGAIWVYSEQAVLDRDPVFVRIAAGAGGTQLGAFRKDADSGSAIAVTGARFVRDSAGAGAAWLRSSGF